MRPVVQALGDWVASWLIGDPSPAELNPELLALFISRDVNHEALPDHRIVVQLELRHEGTRLLWLILERHDVSVCLENPCLPVDVVVKGRTADLYRVYMGRAILAQEIVDGRIVLEGLPDGAGLPEVDEVEHLRARGPGGRHSRGAAGETANTPSS